MINDLTFKILFCLVLDVIMLLSYRWFLFWIPMITVAGLWVPVAYDLTRETRYLQTYMEMVLVAFFFFKWVRERKDKTSAGLFGFGLLAFPALLNAEGHFAFTLWISLLILGGVGVYHFFLENMEWILARDVVDWTTLTWSVAGLWTKAYYARQLDQPWMYQRGGGIWASNHVGGILLLLLPLVKKPWISAIAIVFLLSNFSLGIYICLTITLLGWMAIGRIGKGSWGILVTACIAGALFIGIIPNNELAVSYLQERSGMHYAQTDSLTKGLTARFTTDTRWEIQQAAITMAEQSNLVGVGLGGFVWHLEQAGYPPVYSNAHNIYLTLLDEGGVLFLLAFLGLLCYSLNLARKTNKTVFVSLLSWAVYGFWSGEIYEAASIATAGDYYNFLLILAFLGYSAKASKKIVIDQDHALVPAPV